MIKKIVFIFISILLVACGSTKSVVRTKTEAKKTTDPKKVLVYSKPVKKATNTATKTTSSKTTTASKSTVSKSTVPVKNTSTTPKTEIAKNTSKPSTETKPVVQKTTEIQKPTTNEATTTKLSEEDNLILEIIEKARLKKETEANKPHYVKTEVLEATSKVRVTTKMVQEYIDKYKIIAKSNMSNFGIPASIILAQGILESGTGKGSLSLLANNHFGIKCKSEWTGPSVFFDDDAEQECFRKYESGDESYTDHAVFLTSRPYYVPLFELEKDDYKGWAYGLKKAGYATDVNYPTKLIGIIEKYNLQNYDAEVLGKFIPQPSKQEVATTSNGFTYQVNPGDTLYSISKKLNVPVKVIIEKNNIQNNSLSIGQNLIID